MTVSIYVITVRGAGPVDIGIRIAQAHVKALTGFQSQQGKRPHKTV